MAETRDLFEHRTKLHLEARSLEREQEELRAQVDEFHHQHRLACDELGRKTVAGDMGVDLSTLSNWLSCEPGRGFPPPRLTLYLGKRNERFARWLTVEGWGYLPPERRGAA